MVSSRAGRIMTRMVADILPIAHERRLKENAAAQPYYERAVALYDDERYGEAVEAFRVAAGLGHLDSQYRLARMLVDGEGGEKDFESAEYWFRRAADQGDARAMNGLGCLCESGVKLARDREGALDWFRMAAESGHAEAQFRLGDKYRRGLGVRVDYVQAVRWLRKAADQGLAEAQYWLGDMYSYGEGVPQDYEEASEYYRKATDQGLFQAQNYLGDMYFGDLKVPSDYAEAQKFVEEAREFGEPELGAMKSGTTLHPDLSTDEWGPVERLGRTNDLGILTIGHNLGSKLELQRKDAQAVLCLRKAAEQGLAEAQYLIGQVFWFRLLDWYEVSEAYAEAFKWYRKAAEQGLAHAQYALGYAYGVNDIFLASIYEIVHEQEIEHRAFLQDDAETVKWYRKAAEQGLAKAQYELGDMYEHGRGVPQDNAEAVKWYRKAAEQGLAKSQHELGVAYVVGIAAHFRESEQKKREQYGAGSVSYGHGDVSYSVTSISQSQYRLGGMYEHGRGVPRDHAEACKWYREAARWEHPGAERKLKDLR